jgi:pimeloyl-ACP methyl ester carboxylesterase
MSKSFAKSLRRPVYTLDLRNHGASLAASPHTYSAMANDIHCFLSKHDLNKVQLLGHSMGGRTAMTYALSEEAQRDGRLEKLVVVDTAPGEGEIGQEFLEYMKAMKYTSEKGLASREEAYEALSEVEKVDLAVPFR